MNARWFISPISLPDGSSPTSVAAAGICYMLHMPLGAADLGAERVVEIKITAAMREPHILPPCDSETEVEFLVYVMPCIPGSTLCEKLNRETQFGVGEVARIARDQRTEGRARIARTFQARAGDTRKNGSARKGAPVSISVATA